MAAVMSEVSQMTERSSRAMNHMDQDTKIVHVRLEEWAKWAKDSGIAGYPRQSVTEKAAQYGKLGIPQENRYKAEPMMPDHVAVIDAAVSKLGDIDRRVIRVFYMYWEPAEVMARRCSMRRRQFETVLRRARWRILGFIDASEKS